MDKFRMDEIAPVISKLRAFTNDCSEFQACYVQDKLKKYKKRLHEVIDVVCEDDSAEWNDLRKELFGLNRKLNDLNSLTTNCKHHVCHIYENLNLTVSLFFSDKNSTKTVKALRQKALDDSGITIEYKNDEETSPKSIKSPPKKRFKNNIVQENEKPPSNNSQVKKSAVKESEEMKFEDSGITSDDENADKTSTNNIKLPPKKRSGDFVDNFDVSNIINNDIIETKQSTPSSSANSTPEIPQPQYTQVFDWPIHKQYFEELPSEILVENAEFELEPYNDLDLCATNYL